MCSLQFPFLMAYKYAKTVGSDDFLDDGAVLDSEWFGNVHIYQTLLKVRDRQMLKCVTRCRKRSLPGVISEQWSIP
ncbi:MAG: hypothetical protein KDK25_02870 [Leptospiraceae bacterium]|nr:hypothetical protein [Leptospiraceae bacterium]